MKSLSELVCSQLRIAAQLAPIAVLCSCQALSLGPELSVPTLPTTAKSVQGQFVTQSARESAGEPPVKAESASGAIRWISSLTFESNGSAFSAMEPAEPTQIQMPAAEDADPERPVIEPTDPQLSEPDWLVDAIDPNCPCLQLADPTGCGCTTCLSAEDGRPEGVLGPWPPDEYLCDGGDQQTHVTVNPESKVSGLDLEDTVMHFDTQDGRTIVTPSNSVCIYAPRFAAVRKIVRTSEAGLLLTMREVQQPRPPITEQAYEQPTLVDQPLPIGREQALRGPLALRHRTRGIDLIRSLPVRELVQDFEVFEDLQIIRLGIHRRSEQALLVESVQAAVTWSDNLAPEVLIDEQTADIEVSQQQPEAVYSLQQGPPRLRLIKVASCCSALPGEVITFTLRFDNIGDQTIANVTLLDSLTRRLEYLADSAECSLPAEFFTEQNAGESLVLRWQLNQPLKPGEGGVIRFRCRVR